MRKLALCVISVMLSTAFAADSVTTTRLGWFGDEACTRQRVEKGDVQPNNPDCAKRCVQQGSPLGFIDEKAKTFLLVSNPEKVKDSIGYRVEVSATTSPEGKLEVHSVKRLSQINAMCDRRRPKKE